MSRPSSRHVLAACLAIAALPAPVAAQRMINAAPPEIVAMSLPRGELQGMAAGPHSAMFLDTGRTTWSGTKVDAWVLTVFDPAFKAGDGMARYNVERASIDCATRRFTFLGANSYDAEGQSVIWLPADPPAAITQDSNFFHAAKVVCSAAPRPSGPLVTGYAGAAALTARLVSESAR